MARLSDRNEPEEMNALKKAGHSRASSWSLVNNHVANPTLPT
jgi:hypothetical protein